MKLLPKRHLYALREIWYDPLRPLPYRVPRRVRALFVLADSRVPDTHLNHVWRCRDSYRVQFRHIVTGREALSEARLSLTFVNGLEPEQALRAIGWQIEQGLQALGKRS